MRDINATDAAIALIYRNTQSTLKTAELLHRCQPTIYWRLVNNTDELVSDVKGPLIGSYHGRHYGEVLKVEKDGEELFFKTVKEAAEHLNCSTQQIYMATSKRPGVKKVKGHTVTFVVETDLKTNEPG